MCVYLMPNYQFCLLPPVIRQTCRSRHIHKGTHAQSPELTMMKHGGKAVSCWSECVELQRTDVRPPLTATWVYDQQANACLFTPCPDPNPPYCSAISKRPVGSPLHHLASCHTFCFNLLCLRVCVLCVCVGVPFKRRTVVCPIIDVISDDTFEYMAGSDMTYGGFNWKLNFRWYPVPQREMDRRKGDRTLPVRYKAPPLRGTARCPSGTRPRPSGGPHAARQVQGPAPKGERTLPVRYQASPLRVTARCPSGTRDARMGFYFIRNRITNASSIRHPSAPTFFGPNFQTAPAHHPQVAFIRQSKALLTRG